MPTVNFLGDSNIALYSLIVVDIWEWTPQVMLIVLAGITSISTEPFESAMVDGATPWQVTWHITLPLLRPTIFTAFLLRLIDVLKTFDIMYSMTQGGPGYATETMNILSYRQAFEFMQFGSASSMLIVFFVVVMAVSYTHLPYYFKLDQKELEEYFVRVAQSVSDDFFISLGMSG